MNEKIFDDFTAMVQETGAEVFGISYWKDGETVTKEYDMDGYPKNLYSGTKTFVSMAIGICLGRGLIKNLSDPWIRYFPDLEAAPGTEKQRILELLHMQTGRDDIENRYAHEGDLLADWARMPLLWEPGAHFEYCNMSSYTLGRLVERVSGQSLLDFCRENIFAPVGIRFPQWFADQQGHHFGHSALHLFLDEFAKQGILMANEGSWEGRQIVPKEYMHAMYTDTVSSEEHRGRQPQWHQGYGYQVWMCDRPGIYRADGFLGQYNIVSANQRAVVTIQSRVPQPHLCEKIIDTAIATVLQE